VVKVQGNGRPFLELEGHDGAVTDITDTLCEFGKFATCADDGTFRLWRIGDMDTPRQMCDPISCDHHRKRYAATVSVHRQVGDRACWWEDYMDDNKCRSRGWEFVAKNAVLDQPVRRTQTELRQSRLNHFFHGAN